MDFATAVRTCFQKYASFAGRARRAEFWYFWLFVIIGSVLTSFLDTILGLGSALESLFGLTTFLPHLAVTARRLHDTDHSGWWQVAYIVPLVVMVFAVLAEAGLLATLTAIALLATFVYVLVWLVRVGDRGPNRFGEDPLGPSFMAQPA